MRLIGQTVLWLALWAVPMQGESMFKRIPSSHSDRSAAVVVDGCSLLHTTQILPLGEDDRVVDESSDKQLEQVLNRLDETLRKAGSSRNRLVKLNVYAASVDAADLVRKRLPDWCGSDSLPAVCYVETPLPLSGAKVAVDAVAAVASQEAADAPTFGTHPGHVGPADWCLLPPGDVVYVSGQAEPGDLATATAATLDSLKRTLEHLGLDRSRIVQLKCFLDPMKEVAIVNAEIRRFFGESVVPPVVHVQWSGGSHPIEIELIAHAPATESGETVTYQWLPWLSVSPVYCRLARIHGDRRIYVSGITSTNEGDGAAQVRDIFQSLDGVLRQVGSDFRHMAKATYYVSDNDPSTQLNAIRPSLYDPQRPPAASKAMVQGVAERKRGIIIDMIAAPSSK